MVLVNSDSGLGLVEPLKLEIKRANPPTANTATPNPFKNVANNLMRSLFNLHTQTFYS